MTHEIEDTVNSAMELPRNSRAYLAEVLLEALTDALTRIRRNPFLYRKVYKEVRKCRVLHFPYGVILRDQKNDSNNSSYASQEKTRLLEIQILNVSEFHKRMEKTYLIIWN